MEYINIQKNVGHTPRKLRLVADMIRKMDPSQAVEQLMFVNKIAAGDLAKAIKTALANAKNQPGLRFKSIEINEGMKLKRYLVGTAGRGRGRPFQKKLSHIKVVLTDEVLDAQPKVAKIAKTKPKAVKQEVEKREEK